MVLFVNDLTGRFHYHWLSNYPKGIDAIIEGVIGMVRCSITPFTISILEFYL